MDNQKDQVHKKVILNTDVHSAFRKGISDYHDGGDLSKYGGNDDWVDGKAVEENPDDFDGSVALGNEGAIEEDDTNEKLHSGL